MLKHLKLALIALSATLLFTACSDDEGEEVKKVVTTTTSEALIVNQGNQLGGVAGTLSLLDMTSGTLTDGVFQAANSQSLGDTPENAVYHGSKLYIAVYGSNLVWVLDASTKQILQQVTTNEPEWIEADGAYVYVANNDGNVTRIDTASYETKTVAVGPNPAGMAASRGYLYVSISDGYNYSGGYADGKRVAKVNLTTFTKEGDIAVGMNPGKVVADAAGNVFVVCNGDYYTIMPKVYKISADSQTAEEAYDGNQIAVNPQLDVLYVLNTTTDWTTGASTTTYAAYSTTTGDALTTNFATNTDLPASPTGLFVDYNTNHVFIPSDRSAFGYASQGDVYEFDQHGTFLKKYAAGIHPYAVAFRHVTTTTYETVVNP